MGKSAPSHFTNKVKQEPDFVTDNEITTSLAMRQLGAVLPVQQFLLINASLKPACVYNIINTFSNDISHFQWQLVCQHTKCTSICQQQTVYMCKQQFRCTPHFKIQLISFVIIYVHKLIKLITFYLYVHATQFSGYHKLTTKSWPITA